MENRKKFIIVFTAFIILLTIGIIGYMNLLDLNFIDALYMTVITISTVGYTEVGEMTPLAKIFSVGIIFTGLGVTGYAFTSIVSLFLEGEIKDAWRKKIMENKIAKLKNHYILCGAGETGESVIKQFQKKNVSFVVIENKKEKFHQLLEEGTLCILGDATQEDTLQKAQIYNAKGFISSLSNDADNVFTVLTARQMNKNLYIISRAIEKTAHEKLKKAGANNTVSPNEIGGNRMAALILRPSIVSFLEVIIHTGEEMLDLEDVLVCEASELVGKSLKEVNISERVGLIVLAIKKCGEKNMKFNPKADEILEKEDKLIVIGLENQVDKLRKIACDSGIREPFKGC